MSGSAFEGAHAAAVAAYLPVAYGLGTSMGRMYAYLHEVEEWVLLMREAGYTEADARAFIQEAQQEAAMTPMRPEEVVERRVMHALGFVWPVTAPIPN